MTMRNQPTARQVRLGAELRRLREAAGLSAKEVAGLLNSSSTHMSQIEAGSSGISEERLRRLAAHCACADESLVETLVAMAADRTRGWWEEYRGVLPPVFLDVAELEHHATFLREVVITHVPGLMQTPDYARAVFGYMVPELPPSELAPRVEHRMRRRAALEGADSATYETVIHESALRIRVADRKVARTQLLEVLRNIEEEQATVRVIPFDTDGFAGASSAMMYIGGPIAHLDTVLRDSPHGTAFVDTGSQLERFRQLFHKVEKTALGPAASRDFVHRIAKEL
ncbi:helix-turn-helix domain-containing protein [Streptomyces sp. NBC_01288]|uniref:helix-turn-helix domain-containing protein n=1 Tax=Streptomyces sp. NBC_01288 TaxID=2903814 RepID=UPI002E0D97A4|nr:helix-turn-helix domain-containing protein [Streptomyces sp. NBC_01288]